MHKIEKEMGRGAGKEGRNVVSVESVRVRDGGRENKSDVVYVCVCACVCVREKEEKGNGGRADCKACRVAGSLRP